MKSVFGALALALFAGHAVAVPITGIDGTGSPTITDRTGIADFETSSIGTVSSVTSGDVTVSGINGSIRVANDYRNQYNSRGAVHIDNDQGRTNGIRFDFAAIVNAFAFNFGASNERWTLTAFDAAGQLLESVAAPITTSSNAGGYIGLADAGIKYATLTTSFSDYVFIDNLVYAAAQTGAAAVPEPGSMALLGVGAAGVMVMRRRKGAAA